MSDELVRLSSDGIFYTLQGEGPLIGTPAVFVRFDTCNLRCRWGPTICDAHYTSWHPGTLRLPVDVLCTKVGKVLSENKCEHMVITGGEPCLQPHAVKALTSWAKDWGVHTTIETNGTIFVPDSGVDLICLSPKLSSSTPVGDKYEKMHSKNRWNPEAIIEWIHTQSKKAYLEREDADNIGYYFKIVIDREEDIQEALQMLREVGQYLPDPLHVCFMPQGITTQELWERGRWVAEKCKELGVRFTPRIQVDLWGNTPGT